MPLGLMTQRLAKVPNEEIPRLQVLIEGLVTHLTRLVEDLVDLSRASVGKMRLDITRTDIVPIISAVIDVTLPAIKKRHLTFTARLPEQTIEVDADPIRLAQIFGNILGNAAKYTPSGGGITLSVTCQNDLFVLSVADNGIGISPNYLSHVFDPFVQDPNAESFDRTGLGIGLSVVHELVTAHGGTITALSPGIGLGSEFIVTLPLAANQASPT